MANKNKGIEIFLRLKPTKKVFTGFEAQEDTGEVEFTMGTHGEKEVGNPLFKEEIQRYKYNGILPMDIKQEEVFN